MTSNTKKTEAGSNVSVTERLKSLYRLQLVDSKIDRMKTMRGELPLEVRDLEDELAGLNTRISNFEKEIKELKQQINEREKKAKEADVLIKKYTEQQNNVRNNREYESLTKEIEFQELEKELSDKRIGEYKETIEEKKLAISNSKKMLEERNKDLKDKKAELESIIAETQNDEIIFNKEREEIAAQIEPRLLYAYSRLRNNAINKLAVVTIERNACGGCFNKIPPQRQIDIKSNRKIIPCEYCGRIVVDPEILER